MRLVEFIRSRLICPCRFAKDENGAVTTDWVVLTAGIVLAVWAGLILIRGETIDAVVEVFNWVEEAAL